MHEVSPEFSACAGEDGGSCGAGGVDWCGSAYGGLDNVTCTAELKT